MNGYSGMIVFSLDLELLKNFDFYQAVQKRTHLSKEQTAESLQLKRILSMQDKNELYTYELIF